MKFVFLLGRIAFGGFFLYNGINHFRQRQGLSQYAGSKKVPQAEMAVIASGVLLIAGGASIIMGIKPKYGAAAIIAFLASVSPVIHNFWTSQDPGQRMNDTIHFSKNLALLGAALALMGVEEPWPVSVPIGQPNAMDRARRYVRSLAA